MPDNDVAPRAPRGCPGIVPPYLLERLTEAEASLALDAHHRQRRGERLTAPQVPLGAAAAGTAAARRTVSDAHHTTDLPGDVVRDEGEPPTGDDAADEAYDGLGATWSLYWEAFRRDSVDGRGEPLAASVHYGDKYDNAFWNGERMVFGDGDGVTFNRFTVAVDVVGHELTHGVTEASAALVYQGQSGALNESISDVFGSLVKQYTLGQDAADADWLIGAGLFTDAVDGVALRSMKAPGTAYDDPRLGKDPQPATMAGYVETASDNGGVHINSGIANHAFYLAAIAVGGRAWEGAGQVWYDVLTGGSLASGVDFAGFATATTAAASTRFGAGSPQARAIEDAWRQVGVVAAAGPVPEVVRVERSGGLAGQQIARDVDVRALDAPDAGAWRDLLGSSLLASIAAQPPQPDRYVYRIACAPRGLDVTAAEQQLPDHVRTLLERSLRA